MPTNKRRRRIYLAAAFKNQSLMRDLRDKLASLGFEVFGSWIDEDPLTDNKLTRGQYNHVSDKCAFEILKASLFLCYIDKTDSNRGGHHAEFGYAWGKGKVLISVGSAERNCFHQMWKVHQFPSIEAFLQSASSWKSYLPPPVLS